MVSPADDPRWAKLHDATRLCPSCGVRHGGLFALACAKPDIWPGPNEIAPNASLSRGATDILTEDFCVVAGQHFFVRCMLELPIRDAPGHEFGFGLWSSLSRQHFAEYAENFNDDQQGHLGPWFGWLSNGLKHYPRSLNLPCSVRPRDGRQRPTLEILDSDHPLAIHQRTGITFAELLLLYAAHGHDLGLGAAPSPGR